MKAIIIHADDGAGMAGRLDAGLALARRHDAHISLVISTPFRQFVAADPFGGMYLANDALAKAQAQDEALADRLRADLGNEDVAWDVVTTDGDDAGSLALAGLLADLVVVSLDGGAKRGRAGSMLAGDVALAAARPVLAMPVDLDRLDLDGPVMVAWNDSVEAANALRSAVPVLAGRSVTLVQVGGEAGQVAATDALAYLSRHGIHADWRRVERDGQTVEERLAAEALALGATLIVMGAFGKSRLRETLFGGVTRYLLDGGTIPLWMAH